MEDTTQQPLVQQAPLTEVVPAAPEATPTETATEQTPAAPEATSLPIDPAFNCQSCFGEGLKDQYTLCPACQGTGKV